MIAKVIASQSNVVSEHDRKDPISGVHVSQGSAETLVKRVGITIHHSLSNICAKNYQNRLMCVEVIVCNVSVVFFRQCTWLSSQEKINRLSG